jgi:hypothetical protein
LLLAVDQRLDETLRYGLEDFVVVGDVADRPLAQFGAAESKEVAARFGDVFLETLVDFVVGAEGRVGRVFGHEEFPVVEQIVPGLK